MTAGGDPARLRDQAGRDRITQDLDANLLVEAGAGSGKTTSLVARMAALVESGRARAKDIAAVTFTRKAASQLAQKFQAELEKRAASLDAGDSVKVRLEDAISSLDEVFLGTIHSFCARLLRERPLEVGLDPNFRQMADGEMAADRDRYWTEHLELLAHKGDPRLAQLDDTGLDPGQIRGAHEAILENPDVDFSKPPAQPPDRQTIQRLRRELDALLDQGRELLPEFRPRNGWDQLATKLRKLLLWRRARAWETTRVLMAAIAQLHGRKLDVTLYKWAHLPRGGETAKDYRQLLLRFIGPKSPAKQALEQWWAHRYSIIIDVATSAAKGYAAKRRRAGTLNYADLLMLTSRLLREHPGVREALGKRYRYLLVDEFQDTDPIQAEVALLLASDPKTGPDWRTARPRAGALFVVGDPKQSIYRFRRADIALYDFVKGRFKDFGDVVSLTTNFRSLPAFGELVRVAFDHPKRFGPTSSRSQAAYAPLATHRTSAPGRLTVYRFPSSRFTSQRVRSEARVIASMIARRTGKGGDRRPSDFLILTRAKANIREYALAIEAEGVPVDVAGAAVRYEKELGGLKDLVSALADPENEALIVNALLGPFFGVNFRALRRFRERYGGFSLDRRFRSGEDDCAAGGANCGGSTSAPSEDDDCCCQALAAFRQIQRWWRLSRRNPADLMLERIVRDAGIFPLAASGNLAEMRTGAVAYVLDAVRDAVLQGRATMTDAVEAFDMAVSWEDAEAALDPARRDSARVMNLHKAKGLEAPIVILADPRAERVFAPTMRVVREGRVSIGRLSVSVPSRFRFQSPKPIARPIDWPEHEKLESEAEEAERVRLQYVAATRAMDELWIADSKDKDAWREIRDAVLDVRKRDKRVARVLELAPKGEPIREFLPPDRAAELGSRTAEAEAKVRAATSPSYLKTRPSEHSQEAGEDAPSLKALVIERFEGVELSLALSAKDRGAVVHAVLEAWAGGARDEALERAANAALWNACPGLPQAEARKVRAELRQLASAFAATAFWKRAAQSPACHQEASFAVRRDALSSGEAPAELIEGVIDLVFRGSDGWVVADYKTSDERAAKESLRSHQGQVDLYAEAWALATGEAVAERALIYTTAGLIAAW